MDKKKIQIIVIAVLAVILMYLGFGNMFSRMSGKVKSDKSGSVSVETAIADFHKNIDALAAREVNDGLIRLLEEKAEATVSRNPFEITVTTEVSMPEEDEEVMSETTFVPQFTVMGIIAEANPADSSIIVGEDIYKVGEVVQGWTVERIESDRVFFKKGETEYICSLYALAE